MSDFKTDRYRTALTNLERALQNLRQSVSMPVNNARDLSGIIKDFEIVYELSWKILKKFLEKEGHQTLSAREAFAKASQLGYLKTETVWIKIIEDRNLTVHTYNEKFARQMSERIKSDHLPAFEELFTALSKAE